MKRERQQGYTLIELLVAISLMAIIGVTLVSVFQQAYVAHRRVNSLLLLSNEGRITLDRMERDLVNAIPLQLHPLVGKATELSFTTVLPVAMEDQKVCSIPVWVSYSVSAVNDAILYRTVVIPGESKVDSSVMCRHIDSLSFEYAYASGEHHIQWNSESTLGLGMPPNALRILLFLTDPIGRHEQTHTVSKTIYLPTVRFPSHEDT